MSSTGIRPSRSSATPEVAARRTRSQLLWVAAFVGGHVVLAMLMRAFPAIATFHAVGCLLGGLLFAATTRRTAHVALVVAYIAGCEVLWRMSKASVFWEYGKYAMVAVMLVTLARTRARRNVTLASFYLGLLLPSAGLTFIALGFAGGRDQLSFALSGPLAIACAIVYFSSIRLTAMQLRATFAAFVAPICGVSTLVFIKSREATDLVFVNGSNSMASGGFGPNQVSAVLGLGMLLLVLVCFDGRLMWWLRLLLLGIAAMLAFQTVLTFARGGIMLALVGIFAAMFVLLRSNRRARVAVVSVGLLSFVLGNYVVEPQLEETTGGSVAQRFSNTRSSGRDQIVESELEMFMDNPAIGVGPGIGAALRLKDGQIGPSHTEYTRMLAEHGVLGALSLVCLGILGLRAIRGNRNASAQAIGSALVIWAALFLAIYSTRLAAPAFALGLAFAVPRPPAAARKSPLARQLAVS